MSRSIAHELPGGTVPLASVAGSTGRNNVVLGEVAALGQRVKMIHLQVAGSPTIHAGVIVEGQNILPLLGGERSDDGTLEGTATVAVDLSGKPAFRRLAPSLCSRLRCIFRLAVSNLVAAFLAARDGVGTLLQGWQPGAAISTKAVALFWVLLAVHKFAVATLAALAHEVFVATWIGSAAVNAGARVASLVCRNHVAGSFPAAITGVTHLPDISVGAELAAVDTWAKVMVFANNFVSGTFGTCHVHIIPEGAG
jgi:hypothetical protein